MDGEQVFDIPLDSLIDTETSSQIVNAQVPTLSYNPQEYQGGVLPNSLRYEHDGWAAGMYVHEFPDDGEWMKCHTTQVETGEETDISRIRMSDEYTCVRQQWDSSMETEEYWWINPTHILQLTKHEFIILKKGEGLHHWNGDNWDVVSRTHRPAILTDRAFKWMCSSTGDGSDVKFIVLEYVDDYSFNVIVYHSLTMFPSHVTTTRVTIERRPLNAWLVNGGNNNLTTYHPVDCTNLVSQSKISAASVSGYLLLGIAYTKGLAQWTLVIDGMGNVVRKVTGYGHVGIHGELTGGEIPSWWCDENGVVPRFTVHSIDYLQHCHNGHGVDISGQFDNPCVVGTESQHWFITTQIDYIVSHMVWNGSGFTPVLLKLNNNYAAQFVSPSMTSAIVGDFDLHMDPMTKLLPMFYEGGAESVMKVIHEFLIKIDPLSWLMDKFDVPDFITMFMPTAPFELFLSTVVQEFLFPNIYYIMPKFGTLQFLQMALGQYAYVWYNSTEHTLEKDIIRVSKSYADMTPLEQKEYKEQAKEVKAVTDDQLSFDKQTFTQTEENGNPFTPDADNAWKLFMTIILGLAGTAIDYIDSKVTNTVVNAVQGHQSSGAMTDDRSFGQMFLENVWNIIGTDTGYTGRMVTLTNSISALKTLDMFYSVGDNVQCYAGPGHVSHSMQAQCVSQSINSVRESGYLIGCLIPCPALSKLEVYFRKMLWGWLRDFSKTHVDNLSAPGGEIVQSTGTIQSGEVDPKTALQVALWSVINVVAMCLYYVTEWCEEFITDAIDGMMPGGRFIPYGKVDRNNFNVEGKHNYGSRSCTFMWPCFNSHGNTYTDERVQTAVENYDVNLDLGPSPAGGTVMFALPIKAYDTTTDYFNQDFFGVLRGKLRSKVVKTQGVNSIVGVPDNMAVVEGCTSFLPTTPFKNERVGLSSPVFGFPPIQDYILDSRWELGMTCTAGSINAVSVKDTKLIDGRYSNAYVTDSFCGITSSYGAFEVKKGIQKDYLRPYAVTPNILATNTTGINAYSRNIAYHAFDGYSTRIIKWTGGAGLDKERRNFLYTFLADGNIKMSNNYPANVYFGYFKGAAPVQAIPSRRGLTNYVYNSRDLEGMNSVVNNEYRAMERYSIPVFTEMVGILPVVVRTYGSFVLKRYSGVTSLCTELRETDEGVYKMEAETDFAIRNNTYRVTPEYLNVTKILDSRTDVQAVWAKLGMKYIGSDQDYGYFYNQSTHQYYAFDGGRLNVRDTWNRFKSIDTALYDFLSQDVAYRCDSSYDELDVSPYKADNDLMINLFDQRGVHRNMYPPIRTIMSEDSDFLLRTFPSGVTYQGPNRCIINRSIYQDYMLEDIKRNKRQWLRLPREDFHPWRKYSGEYVAVNIPVDCPVKGWTHNPFVFVTSTIGLSDDTDCIYEWEVVFTWSEIMDKIYEQNEYVCVSMAAKTFAPGGVVTQRPTHIFLTRELCSRKENPNYGYYSFLYRSNGGAGNREQLFLWADGYIEVAHVKLHVKQITQKRTTPLTIQADVDKMIEI